MPGGFLGQCLNYFFFFSPFFPEDHPVEEKNDDYAGHVKANAGKIENYSRVRVRVVEKLGDKLSNNRPADSEESGEKTTFAWIFPRHNETSESSINESSCNSY